MLSKKEAVLFFSGAALIVLSRIFSGASGDTSYKAPIIKIPLANSPWENSIRIAPSDAFQTASSYAEKENPPLNCWTNDGFPMIFELAVSHKASESLRNSPEKQERCKDSLIEQAHPDTQRDYALRKKEGWSFSLGEILHVVAADILKKKIKDYNLIDYTRDSIRLEVREDTEKTLNEYISGIPSLDDGDLSITGLQITIVNWKQLPQPSIVQKETTGYENPEILNAAFFGANVSEGKENGENNARGGMIACGENPDGESICINLSVDYNYQISAEKLAPFLQRLSNVLDTNLEIKMMELSGMPPDKRVTHAINCVAVEIFFGQLGKLTYNQIQAQKEHLLQKTQETLEERIESVDGLREHIQVNGVNIEISQEMPELPFAPKEEKKEPEINVPML